MNVIHYHGTPITPRKALLEMSGRHFCVSFADPRDLEDCIRIGQSLMLDNGAFTAFTKGKPMDIAGYIAWCEQHLAQPHWAVIPDVIDGDEDQQRAGIAGWPFPPELSAPVWHLGLSLDWMLELADNWPRICLGSSGQFWEVGSPAWAKRMDEAFDALARSRRHLPWIHGMRMLSQSDGPWPLASADSTNVARNYKRNHEHPDAMAGRIDAMQPANRWRSNPQLELM
jgi:hypothetical protein